MFAGNTYSNIADAPSNDGTDKCYYNFDNDKRMPDTAITVEELPDVVLQPEFKKKLDEQFNVSCSIFDPKNVLHLWYMKDNMRCINMYLFCIQCA